MTDEDAVANGILKAIFTIAIGLSIGAFFSHHPLMFAAAITAFVLYAILKGLLGELNSAAARAPRWLPAPRLFIIVLVFGGAYGVWQIGRTIVESDGSRELSTNPPLPANESDHGSQIEKAISTPIRIPTQAQTDNTQDTTPLSMPVQEAAPSSSILEATPSLPPLSLPVTDAPESSVGEHDRPAAGVDTAPQPITKTHTLPPYPEAARRQGQHGTTVLAVMVGSGGAATDCDVAISSGSIILDDAACAYVKAKWRWQPATASGIPTSEVTTVRIQWKL